jgi:glyoxylase-like metal-dependent hydrolase (beta-lactamase superfamily II)
MKIQYKTSGICVFESALFRTTATVLQTPDLVLVVDPTWLPEEVEHICHYVERQRGDRPVYLLFTHSDYDHVIGYRAFPGATVIASQALADNPAREEVIEQIRRFDDDYYISRSYEIAYPRVDIAVTEDGQILEIGKTRLRFYLAPGHNADGIFTLVEPLQVWLAGDYLCDVEFPYLYHSYRDYLDTLEKAGRIIRGWEPQVLVPGHGEVAAQRLEMQRRRQEAIDYLRRLEQSVAGGPAFPEEQLWQRYRFPRLQRRYHQANVELVRKELNS